MREVGREGEREREGGRERGWETREMSGRERERERERERDPGDAVGVAVVEVALEREPLVPEDEPQLRLAGEGGRARESNE